tara:strand:+ start:135 stop:356 length:222 start_codon:yes stop_codon:yes gene_type:complete
MKRYALKEFKKVVEKSDIVYGQVSLNAAINIPARLRKKSLLEQLAKIDSDKDSLGYYGELTIDKKGRKILKLV